MSKTSIAIIIDRSGSMASLRDDVIGGYNTFIQQQKEVEGECEMSLYFFDTKYEKVYENVPIQEVEELKEYTPGGMTALYDAVGQTMDSLGETFAAMEESDRPEKVMLVIMTDGAENSSTDYSQSKVAEMIEHQKSKYSWEFMFLGANIDAEEVGSSLNITNNTQFAATSKGMGETYADISRSVTRYRSV